MLLFLATCHLQDQSITTDLVGSMFLLVHEQSMDAEQNYLC